MTLWDHPRPEHLAGAAAEITTGHRVARLGTVSFVRSGFARVKWDDGSMSDEWAADLVPGEYPRNRHTSTEEER